MLETPLHNEKARGINYLTSAATGNQHQPCTVASNEGLTAEISYIQMCEMKKSPMYSACQLKVNAPVQWPEAQLHLATPFPQLGERLAAGTLHHLRIVLQAPVVSNRQINYQTIMFTQCGTAQLGSVPGEAANKLSWDKVLYPQSTLGSSGSTSSTGTGSIKNVSALRSEAGFLVR